jgi:hypothetical protein
MRDETRKKLDEQQSSGGLVTIVGVVSLTLLGAVVYLTWTLPAGAPRDVQGVVRARWTSTNEEQLKRSLKLEVLLDDGRYAIATSTVRNVPEKGSRIVLRDQINWLGYHHYYWDGFMVDTSAK